MTVPVATVPCGVRTPVMTPSRTSIALDRRGDREVRAVLARAERVALHDRLGRGVRVGVAVAGGEDVLAREQRADLHRLLGRVIIRDGTPSSFCSATLRVKPSTSDSVVSTKR